MRDYYKVLQPKYADFNKILKFEIIKKIKERWFEVHNLAQKLKDQNAKNTARNIFDFTLEKVKYQQDKNDEIVRSPSHILFGYNQNVGDCKSHSILNCSLLLCLDMPSIIKFVGYNENDKTVNHVYTETYDNNGIIVMDSTIKVFNTVVGNEKHFERYLFKKNEN